MLEVLTAGFFYIVVIIGTATVFLKVVDWQRDRHNERLYEILKREHPERVYGTPEYEARFSHPDLPALEKHLGRPLPAELKKLYADTQTMLSKPFEVIPPDSQSPDDNLPLNCFFPADAHAITDLWPSDDFTLDQLPFATDGSEGVYYLDLQQGGDDPAVCLYYYDGGFHVEIASSLSEFLAWKRISTFDDLD